MEGDRKQQSRFSAASDAGSGVSVHGLIPNLCAAGSVLVLILVGELLSLAIVLSDLGLQHIHWQAFGVISFLMQWIVLVSAATLCYLRVWLNRLSAAQAVSISYSLILSYTVMFSGVGLFFLGVPFVKMPSTIASNTVIAAIFAGILLRYLYLQLLLKQREQAELEARIQALQARIRPHFLFNSLNSIATLIHHDPGLAEKLVVDLSLLFRAGLSLPQQTTIAQEVALCRSFFDIEKVRLGKRLELDWSIEEEALTRPILNLLLQPLLENAIYHGIQPLKGGGKVAIDIKVIKGDVVVKIVNPKARGDVLGEIGDLNTSSRGNGIALSNIRDRLAAVYDKTAYLRIVKGETDFTVLLRYPAVDAYLKESE